MTARHDRRPLSIRPRRSWRLAVFAGVTHGLAGMIVLLLPLDLYQAPLFLFVGLSALHTFAVHVLRQAPWSIRTALWSADGTWLLTLRSGATIEARLSPATFVSLPLVALNFSSGTLRSGSLRRHALPLFSDALAPEQLRRLRQRLRLDGGKPDTGVSDA